MAKHRLAFSVSLIVVSLVAHRASASIYDAAADFSATSNPIGAWQYGWSSTLGSAFNAYPTNTVVSGLDFWIDPAIESGFSPSVAHNSTAVTLDLSSVAFWAPGQLTLHPGPLSEYSIVRWTAPVNMVIDISANFEGRDTVPTTTDVHVLHNNSSLFDDAVNAFGVGPNFSTTVTVVAGDTIDFAVGDGGNFYIDDTTGLQAVITQGGIPEPRSLLVWTGLALFGMTFHRARGKRAANAAADLITARMSDR